MPSIADLVEEPTLRRLALPATITEGRHLAEQGLVKLDEFGPLSVSAMVGEAQSVVLRAEDGELRWSCTCPAGRSPELCEHAVAVAIETWQRAPAQRT
jgi:uncharacterized Zn finger protein